MSKIRTAVVALMITVGLLALPAAVQSEPGAAVRCAMENRKVALHVEYRRVEIDGEPLSPLILIGRAVFGQDEPSGCGAPRGGEGAKVG